jgi:hypothetical protein
VQKSVEAEVSSIFPLFLSTFAALDSRNHKGLIQCHRPPLLIIARPDTIGTNRACNRSLNNWPQSNLIIYRHKSVGIIQDRQLTGMV